MGVIHFGNKEGYNILVLFIRTSSFALIYMKGNMLASKQMTYAVALNILIDKNTENKSNIVILRQNILITTLYYN
jgi:hypothetical protein